MSPRCTCASRVRQGFGLTNPLCPLHGDGRDNSLAPHWLAKHRPPRPTLAHHALAATFAILTALWALGLRP